MDLVVPIVKFNHSFFVQSATSSENDPSHQFDVASTLSKLRIVVRGTTPSITWQLRKGPDRSLTGTLMASGTATSTTTGHEVTSFSSATIAAAEHVWLVTTAQSGTVLSFRLTFYGTEDVS